MKADAVADGTASGALAPGLLRNLSVLRWFAVAGQAITIALVPIVTGIGLATGPLWGGVVALFLFNLWASRRARHVCGLGAGEASAHLAVDILVLAWLICWSGGAMNPFAPLFLLPIALAAISLPVRWVVAIAALGCASYAFCAVFGLPLPHAHATAVDAFNLHLAGMAVMFAIAAAVITFFLTRLAHTLRARERELSRLRERFVRNEGIVALATHAAAVAHELNTPLGTLTLMLEDQLAGCAPATGPREEIQTMAALVDVCRDRVRELAAPADTDPLQAGAATAVERIVDRWQLLRPAIELERSGSLADAVGLELDPGAGHLLMALLDNAADATELAGSAYVALHLECSRGALAGSVSDEGGGFERDELPRGAVFRSSKPDGLGIGLALSHAIVERLGGELGLRAAGADGRTCVEFRLPLRAMTAPDA